MSISSMIRQIGRGVKGSSDLTRDQAKFFFSQILSKEISQIELGAFCIAMRMKGESAEELAGFMDAISEHLKTLDTLERRTIILPSYNGSRKQMNLTPLLALQLSKLGFLVIVQGVMKAAERVSTYEIFEQLNWPIHIQTSSVMVRQEKLPIFVPLHTFCPALKDVLDIRDQLGLRNSGHVLAKLMNPVGQNAWQVANYTHPEYPKILEEYFAIFESNVILMRGHEGEPTSSLLRVPELTFLKQGHLAYKSSEYRFNDTENLSGLSLEGHVEFIQRVIAGQEKMPLAILKQAELFDENCI